MLIKKKLLLAFSVLLLQGTYAIAYNQADVCNAARIACGDTKGDHQSLYKYGAKNITTTGGGGLDTVHATCLSQNDPSALSAHGNEKVTFTVKGKEYTGWAQHDSKSRVHGSIGLMCKAKTLWNKKSTCHDGKTWDNCLF